MELPLHIVAVMGFIKNDNNEILMVKTHHRKTWEFPGGQVELGENLEDALKRETIEESGVNITVDKLIGLYTNSCQYPGYNGVKWIPSKLMMDFECTYVDGDLTTSDETSHVEWVKKDEVLSRISNETMVRRFKAYLEGGETTYVEYVTRPEFEIKLDRTV